MLKPVRRDSGGAIGTRIGVVALVVATAGVLAVPGFAQAALTPGCVTSASAAGAVQQLYGSGTDVVREERVAGLDTVLALEPRIAPGTRHRAIQAGGDRFCDATTGFNDAFSGGGAAAARSYAQLAAAPYFDDVTIRAFDQTAPGVYKVDIHALTNGVEATWRIVADAGGVRLAKWTATAFGEEPFTPQIEGLTALPGTSERYRLMADGLLRAGEGLPGARAGLQAAGPSVRSRYRASDGFRIDISYGGSPIAPSPGTGGFQANIVRTTRDATKANYEEFLDWGFTKGWIPADRGFVYVNDALSAVCIACVFIADDFQIHISSFVLEALDALGYEYPNRRKAYFNVIGHEMFHNFQNRYVKPGSLANRSGRDTSSAYSEGTARFQETLHRYSDVSRQPKSLLYAQDLNGCNGFDSQASPDDLDDAMAEGPFAETIYNACFFWMPWYARYGFDAFEDLVERTMPAAAAEDNNHKEAVAAVSAASGKRFVRQLGRFAAGAITRHGYRWRERVNRDSFDWATYLERWKPAPLARGQSSTRTLSDGGLMAHQIQRKVRVRLTGPRRTRLIVIRAQGGQPRIGYHRSGRVVKAPQGNQRVWVLAAYPPAGEAEVTMSLERPHKNRRQR